MQPMSTRWETLGDSASPAEQAALDAFRELLPDDGITRAWANLTFIDQRGRTAEIDVLLLTKVGFFVVELKGWHGTVTGTQQTWTVTSPSGARRYDHNPLILADSKAKRLASFLKAQLGHGQHLPFLGAIVVMHGHDSKVDLDENALDGVYALDGFSVGGALKKRLVSTFLSTPPSNPNHEIDGFKAKVVGVAAKAADFKPTPKMRFIGQYSLENADPIGDGPSWQDFVAVHPSAKGLRRRVRLFDYPPNASSEERQQIEQSAKREFQLTLNIQHPGITGPLDYFDTASGPALVFRHSDAQTLSDYLVAEGASLGIDDRLALIRKLAEVLRYAHDRRLVHRALSPLQVYVESKSGSVEVSIRDWLTGRLSGSSHATTAPSPTIISGGATDFRGLTSAASWIYLAPEAHHSTDNLPGIPLDVYGLGALSYLILTGQPPAANLPELQAKLEQQGGLDPSAVAESLQPSFAEVVLNATAASETDRLSSVDEFLEHLDIAWELETSDQPEKPPAQTDPLDAITGQFIGDRFEVRGRRGSGSTGTALVVIDFETDEKQVILKLARNDAAGARLKLEAEVLASLDHPRVVRLLAPPLEVDGRTGLLLTDAGKTTLAERIAREGRLTIGQLEQYGSDLLDAVAHLDLRGVFHRDIKPANLGISPDPGTRIPRLTLFDLSLAREPLENVASGSSGYLDPYLGTGTRRQFDRAAELYAVTVTLFEMATAQMPWWHTGTSGPSGPSDHVVVAPSSFEDQVAAPLVEFFTKAFAPDAAKRYPDAGSLAAAWAEVFAALDTPVGDDGTGAESSYDEAAARASLDTPLADSGLSARALSGLSRVAATTVGELLGTSPVALNSLPGLGERYRKEIKRRLRQWRTDLMDAPLELAPVVIRERGVESVVDSLVPATTARSSAKTLAEVTASRVLLGLDDAPDAQLWPTTAQLSERLGVERSDLTQTIATAAVRWSKNQALVEASEELEELAHAHGRVMTLLEASNALMVRRGSVLDGSARLRRAAGLVRAIIEADAQADEPRFQTRRLVDSDVTLIALTRGSDPGGTGDRHPAPESLLDSARTLGVTARELVADGAIVSGSIARATLRDVPSAGVEFSDDRLVRLAAAVAPGVALSSFGELYSVTIDRTVAAGAALRGWSAASVPEEAIRRRVSGRFPALAPLPARPELDEIVEQALPGFAFENGFYQRPDTTRGALSSTHGSTVVGSTPRGEVDRQLRDSLRRSSALTLAIAPRRYDFAQRILGDVYGVRQVDVAELVVSAVRDMASAQNVDWDLVLRADADLRPSSDWQNLAGLVQDAVREPWGALMATPKPLLLTHLGPLVRYGLGGYLSDLLDLSRPRAAARWLLVPRLGSSPVPMLEGSAVPLGADKWIDLPPGMDLIDLPSISTSTVGVSS